jgi:hypothetical protein
MDGNHLNIALSYILVHLSLSNFHREADISSVFWCVGFKEKNIVDILSCVTSL